MTAVNEEKLNAFIGQMLTDLSGAFSVPLVRIGDRLGLYKTLHEKGAMNASELAAASGCDERYLREWLCAQAAANHLTHDPGTDRFLLSPEQAMVCSTNRGGRPLTRPMRCASQATQIGMGLPASPGHPHRPGAAWPVHSACRLSSLCNAAHAMPSGKRAT